MAGHKVQRRPKITLAEWEYLKELYRKNLPMAEMRAKMKAQFGRSFTAKTITTCYRLGYPIPAWANTPIKELLAEEQKVARGIAREREKAEGAAPFKRQGILDAAEQISIEGQGVRGSFAAAITMLGNLSNLREASLAASKAVGQRIALDVQAGRMSPLDAIELIRRMGQATKAAVEAFHTSQKALRLHFGAPEQIIGLATTGLAEFNGEDMVRELGPELVKAAILDLVEGRTTDAVAAFLEWQDSRERAIDVEPRTVQ